MALTSTIFRAELQIADIDRGYYNTHTITVARHPSETDERMMMRILAFIMHASEQLSFAGGLSTSDEPDLWKKDLTGAIVLWIMVGQPDKKQIRKACGRAQQVVIYAYGQAADLWCSSLEHNDKPQNAKIIAIPVSSSQALVGLVQRSMKLQCTIQDGTIWLTSPDGMVEIEP